MEGEDDTLSSEDQAYFDSRGETEIKAPADAADKPEPAAADPVADAEVGDDEADIAEAEAEGEQQPGAEPKRVPLAALTKTRQEARAERAGRIAAEQRAAILEDRWNTALQQMRPQQEQEAAPAIPDMSDPQAVLDWARNELVGRKEREAAEAKERTEREAGQRAFQQAYEAVNDTYTKAAKADPEIVEAHNAVRNSLGNELLAMGYTEAQARSEIGKIENQHLVYIAQNNLEIGPYLKSLAKARGWAPKPKADPAEDAQERVARLADAVDGSTSLSGAGGGAPRVLDAQAIANMKPDEFEAWLGKPGNHAKFKKMAGG